jgi:hypothetical protein
MGGDDRNERNGLTQPTIPESDGAMDEVLPDPLDDTLPDADWPMLETLGLPTRSTSTPRGGRPTLLTERRARRLLRALCEGAYRQVAAQAVGIAPETLSR